MRKIKIKRVGGASGNQKAAPFNNWFDNGRGTGEPNLSVNSTLQPADWDEANLEAEKGEVVVTNTMKDGIPESYSVGGNRHYDGGTPLRLLDNSFIFSRDKAMKIKDEEILKQFGKGAKKSGYTPAEIAKKYDLNEYKKVLLDPNSDKRQKSTAELMISNYNEKLAKLALVQESKKGFPEGVPFIAQPYLDSMNFNPADILTTQAQQQNPNTYQVQMGGGTGYHMMPKGSMMMDGMMQDNTAVNKFYPKVYVADSYTNAQKKDAQDLYDRAVKSYNKSYLPSAYTMQDAVDYVTGKNTDSGIGLYAKQYGGESLKVLPKAQMGKQKGAVDTYDVNEAKFLKALFPNVTLPMDLVEAKQAKTSSGTHGRFEKSAADKNWNWYQKPVNWKDDSSVRGAQEAYNTELSQRFLNAGYTPEEASYYVSRIGFVGDAGKPNSIDGKAGKYTETRVMPDIPSKKVADQVAAKTLSTNTAAAVPVNHFQQPTQGEVPADFWLQDKIKTVGAFNDMGRIKKYMPWQATFNPYLPTPTFYDPTRELAANAEQSNIASQATAMYAGPQAMGARLSQIQGQGAQNAANILGRYNNQNVSVANQFEQNNAQTMNQFGQMRADQATQLYDKNVATNQQFDNAKAMARQNLRSSFIDALSNRGQTQAMNSLYPQFAVDPNTGGTTYFKNPRAITPDKEQNTNVMELAQQYLTQYPSFSNQQAFDAAKATLGYK